MSKDENIIDTAALEYTSSVGKEESYGLHLLSSRFLLSGTNRVINSVGKVGEACRALRLVIWRVSDAWGACDGTTITAAGYRIVSGVFRGFPNCVFHMDFISKADSDIFSPR